MPYSVKTKEKDNYILLTASGEIVSPEDLVSVGQLIQREHSRANCHRFLIDERNVHVNIEIQDFIAYIESMIKKPSIGLKVATIRSPENVSKLYWIETILQNRYVPYRQFSHIPEAEEWLMSNSRN